MERYKYNFKFFDTITKESAYVLGIMYSDGYMMSKRQAFGLDLLDKDVVEIVSYYLRNTKNIKEYTFKPNNDKRYRMVVNNKNIYNKLIELGITPCKSKTINFPNSNIIPNFFITHFIRGLFDGDGSLGIYKRKETTLMKASCRLVGTESICNGVTRYLKSIGIKAAIRKSKTIYEVYICGNRQIQRWLDIMYKDSDGLRMERKYKIYVNIVNLNNKTRKKVQS